jgi:hypothetical protein
VECPRFFYVRIQKTTGQKPYLLTLISFIMEAKTQFLLFLLLLPATLAAQHKLKKETTTPRDGDRFIKTEMEYFLTEESTDNVKKTWNIRQLKEKNRKKTYRMNINTGSEIRETVVVETTPDYAVAHHEYEKGAISSSENNANHLRLFSGDSLLEAGYEAQGVYVRYHDKPLLMKFPAELGSKHTTAFTGRGTKNDRLASAHSGTVSVVVDKFGILVLPCGDTLSSVVRVHESREEIIGYEPLSALFDINAPVTLDSPATGDAAAEKIITDSYRWYEEGYRYPVFETVQSRRIMGNKSLPLREATYLYVPAEQEFLKHDPENEKIKQEKNKENKKPENSENSENEIRPIEYAIYPNPATDVLNLKLGTQSGAETTVSLYELSGREAFRKTYPAQNGYLNETYPVSDYPAGTYIIRIVCGDKYAARQIIKQ